MEFALSQNSVPIRLTLERWQHILEGHPELVDNKIDVKRLFPILNIFLKVVMTNF